MGRRGPPPKPTALRVLEGNPGKKRLNPAEPKPPPGPPAAPKWLSPAARAKWNEVVAQLARLQVLTQVDGDALATYCATWVRWRDAEEFLARNGVAYPTTDADGKVTSIQQYPQVAIARQLLQALLRLQQEFGLTPAARVRLQVEAPPPGQEDPDEARFFRGA